MSIFTETFPDFVSASLADRQDRLVNPTRRIELVNYQSSRNSFIRMTSGVEVIGRPDLAKKYVLQGGTLNDNKARVGVGENGAYSSKTPGSSTTKDGVNNLRGIRPMPGITNMTAECKTAYGSLFEATVNFTCWDIKQLEELELLFMRPGYTVLLEWGWAYNGRQPEFYDILNSPAPLDFQQAYIDLFKKCESNKGNYEALLGTIKNYQWSARPDGGYDCTTNIIALGEVLESLKINYAPYNINLEGTNSLGILKQVEFASGETFPHGPQSFSNIKDYYSKGILSGLLYEIQLFMTYKALDKTPEATALNGSPYPDLKFKDKAYHVFKKNWEFKNVLKDLPLSALGDKFNYYITLESLCNLVNEYIIPLNDSSTSGKVITEITTTNRTYTGVVSASLECIAHPLQISTDPSKCLIKGDLWIEGVTNPTSKISEPSQGVISNSVKVLAGNSPKYSPIQLSGIFVSILDDYLQNQGKTIEDAIRKIREEIVNYISTLGDDRIVLGTRNPKTIDKIITDKEVIFNGERFGLNILKLIGYKDINILYKDISNSVFKSVEQVDGTQKFKVGNKLLDLFTDSTLEINVVNRIQTTILKRSLKKDNSNLKLILSRELEWKPLNYNNNTWGEFLLEEKTEAIIRLSSVNAKKGLEGLSSLRQYFIKDSNYSKGNISNIYLDIDYLHSILTNSSIESRDPSGRNIINILDFFKTICQTIQECTGNINNFDIHIDGRDSKGRIIDLNATPETNKINLFQIELHNTKSTARSYKLESRIFPEQATIIAISAQAYQQSGQLGYNNGTLTAYNNGIKDRLKPILKTNLSISGNDGLESVLINSFSRLNKYFSILKSSDPVKYVAAGVGAVSPDRIVTENLNTKYAPGEYNNALRDIFGFLTPLPKNIQSFAGIIPVILSMDIDGIGGIVIGNLFKINENILPAGYKGTDNLGGQLGFLVKNFIHKVENNDWVTTIEAYPFIVPSNSEIEYDSNLWNKFLISMDKSDLIKPTKPTAGGLTSTGLVYPFAGDFTLTSPALVSRTINGVTEPSHNGSDLAIPSGTQIVAVEDGIINTATFEANGAGNYVQISHTGNLAGIDTISMHLTNFVVKTGQKVKKGDIIGYSGSTGKSSGPHLHFEMRKTGTKTRINPNQYFPGF